jgi:hypothetical protein
MPKREHSARQQTNEKLGEKSAHPISTTFSNVKP